MTSTDGTLITAQNQNSESATLLNSFWGKQVEDIRKLTNNDFKTQELPLARIKKIMKLDEDVKMISAEAPVLFAKAAEIFISELSLRAWVHTEDNKRRTLQRNDIAMAITKYDQFDFLIDIVPRDELKTTKRADENVQRTSMMPSEVQYYFQLAQQHQQNLQQNTTTANTITTTAQPQAQQIQIQPGQVLQQPIQLQVAGGQTITLAQPSGTTAQAGTPQVIQVQPQQASVAVSSAQPTAIQSTPQAAQTQTTQVYQQVISANGEVQNIPMQLSQAEIQALTLQMAGKQPNQPIIIQTQAGGNQTTTQQAADQANGQQLQTTQPIFQVPLNIGGQQVFIQQSTDDEQQQDVTETQ